MALCQFRIRKVTVFSDKTAHQWTELCQTSKQNLAQKFAGVTE